MKNLKANNMRLVLRAFLMLVVICMFLASISLVVFAAEQADGQRLQSADDSNIERTTAELIQSSSNPESNQADKMPEFALAVQGPRNDDDSYFIDWLSGKQIQLHHSWYRIIIVVVIAAIIVTIVWKQIRKNKE